MEQPLLLLGMLGGRPSGMLRYVPKMDDGDGRLLRVNDWFLAMRPPPVAFTFLSGSGLSPQASISKGMRAQSQDRYIILFFTKKTGTFSYGDTS